MRADRLLSILLILQVEGKTSSRDLAQRLEVSERTILRDMDALTSADIPVYAERGAKGGWRLLDDYRTSLTGMNERELLTLFAVRASPFLKDLGLDKAAENALLKVSASLPKTKQQGLDQVKQKLLIDSSDGKDEHPFLPAVQRAIWEEKQIRVSYQRFDGSQSERVISPLGLVLKGKRWYLAGLADSAIKTFRVSRMLNVETLERSWDYPDDFDLETYWQQSVTRFKASLPTYFVKAQVEQSAFNRHGLIGRFAQLEESSGAKEGWLSVVIRFETQEDALAWLLSLGSKVIILEPTALKQLLLTSLRETQALYQ